MLFAMGGYGTYLGFRIKFSDDVVTIFTTTFAYFLLIFALSLLYIDINNFKTEPDY